MLRWHRTFLVHTLAHVYVWYGIILWSTTGHKLKKLKHGNLLVLGLLNANICLGRQALCNIPNMCLGRQALCKAAVTHIFFTFFSLFFHSTPKKVKKSRLHTKNFPTPKNFSLFNSNPQSALFTFFSLWAKMGGGLRRPPARVPIVQDP